MVDIRLDLPGHDNLVIDGYDSIYYIQRWMDQPVIASPKYIQKMQIGELLMKLDRDSLPEVFSLFLVSSQNQQNVAK